MAKIIKKSPAKIFFDDYVSEGEILLSYEGITFQKGYIKSRGFEEIFIPIRDILDVMTGTIKEKGMIKSLIIRVGTSSDDYKDYVIMPRLFSFLDFPIISRSWEKKVKQILLK